MRRCSRLPRRVRGFWSRLTKRLLRGARTACFPDEGKASRAFQVHPGLTSWDILSRPYGTDPSLSSKPRTSVLGYFQPSPSTSSHGTPGQAGRALRDCVCLWRSLADSEGLGSWGSIPKMICPPRVPRGLPWERRGRGTKPGPTRTLSLGAKPGTGVLAKWRDLRFSTSIRSASLPLSTGSAPPRFPR
jgi:hypothetical protein